MCGVPVRRYVIKFGYFNLSHVDLIISQLKETLGGGGKFLLPPQLHLLTICELLAIIPAHFTTGLFPFFLWIFKNCHIFYALIVC